MSRERALLLAVAIMTLFLVGMIGLRQFTLSTGTEVVLKMQPVDPRSLFRGDYVRLGYAINRLKPAALGDTGDFEAGDTIYVQLAKGEPFWRPVSIHRRRPGAAADRVAIRGRVRRSWDKETIEVRYGVETYFVPEGEGRALERPKPGQTISLVLAIDRFGRAAIKAVLVDGKPRYVESLF